MRTIDADGIVHQLRKTEALYDETLLSSTELLQEMLKGRQHPSVAPATGQAAIARLVRSQQRLIESQSDLLRVHMQLADIARAMPLGAEEGAWSIRRRAEVGIHPDWHWRSAPSLGPHDRELFLDRICGESRKDDRGW